MQLSTKIIIIGICITILVLLLIFLSILPLGWTGMSEVIPFSIMRTLIFGALGFGILFILIGCILKVINAFGRRKL